MFDMNSQGVVNLMIEPLLVIGILLGLPCASIAFGITRWRRTHPPRK